MTEPDLWHLEAAPGYPASAASAWRSVATAARDAHALVVSQVNSVGELWSGVAADAYQDHVRRLGNDVEESAAAADDVAGALDRVAGALRTAQRMLGDDLDAVARSLPVMVGNGQVTFTPGSAEQVTLVQKAIHTAHEIRTDLDDTLKQEVGAIERAMRRLGAVAEGLKPIAVDGEDGWKPPTAVEGVVLVRSGDDVIVDTGPGNDTIQIRVDPVTGVQIVTVNGVPHYVSPDKHVVVRAGEGNDVIEVAPDVRLAFTLLGGDGVDTVTGGAGDDTILGMNSEDTLSGRGGSDRISGGVHRDYIDGGEGNDLLSGGTGDDTAYGMGGHDRISGGEGEDYLEGAVGSDIISGDRGDDMISGGLGDDIVRGGGGSDTVYAGGGRDTVDDDADPGDKAFVQPDDRVANVEQVVHVEIKDVGKAIKVEGSPEFVERVRADLDMLAASPIGQSMLAALDQAYDSNWQPAFNGEMLPRSSEVIITEVAEGGGRATRNETIFSWWQNLHIDYNPTFDIVHNGPPITGLFHEMTHIYDFMNGTLAEGTYEGPDDQGVPNRERVAVGLPIDHDHDRNTPEILDPEHPEELTENALRNEMGAPHRRSY